MSGARARGKTTWLRRDMALAGPFLCLVLSQEELTAALRQLKTKDGDLADMPRAGATTFCLTPKDGDGICCVVALSEECRTRSSLEIAGLLVHEASHVVDYYFADCLREDRPASEQRAYALQAAAQRLMTEAATSTRGSIGFRYAAWPARRASSTSGRHNQEMAWKLLHNRRSPATAN